MTARQTRDQVYAHFATVTGAPLPERIGVIYYPTAEAYNAKLGGHAGMIVRLLGVRNWPLRVPTDSRPAMPESLEMRNGDSEHGPCGNMAKRR